MDKARKHYVKKCLDEFGYDAAQVELNTLESSKNLRIVEIEFDEERMKEVFGEEILPIIKENEDIINENVVIMRELGFDDIEGLFERCLNFPNNFKEKLSNLKVELGEEYIDLIENDVSLIENS